MIVNLNNGYPDFIGNRQAFAGDAAGPASYNTTTLDPVSLSNPRLFIDIVLSSGTLSNSGNYYAIFEKSGTGERQTWTATWYTAGGFVEVTNGTNLSAESLPVGGFCGQY